MRRAVRVRELPVGREPRGHPLRPSHPHQVRSDSFVISYIYLYIDMFMIYVPVWGQFPGHDDLHTSNILRYCLCKMYIHNVKFDLTKSMYNSYSAKHLYSVPTQTKHTYVFI